MGNRTRCSCFETDEVLESFYLNLMDFKSLQIRYLLIGTALLPLAPFLYLQGRYTRLKVGRLPDAEGDTEGIAGSGENILKILAIGESTVAGVGAKTHEEALSGQFAKHLSAKTGRPVKWRALGRSGITASETLVELAPQVTETDFDVILIALGGNDVFKISSPAHWRSNIKKLITEMKKRNPKSEVFLANVPMVRDFLAMPDPLRYFLSRFAKIQHFNTIDLINGLDGVYYFEEVDRVDKDFFSDGMHPSASGYDSWSEAMVEAYLKKSRQFSDSI